jgi:hypothetical protein
VIASVGRQLGNWPQEDRPRWLGRTRELCRRVFAGQKNAIQGVDQFPADPTIDNEEFLLTTNRRHTEALETIPFEFRTRRRNVAGEPICDRMPRGLLRRTHME